MDTPNSNSTCSSATTTNSNNPNISKNNSTNIISSDSSAVHDSPIYSYISNLSPIQPVKAAPVGQGFPGLASPPLVFKSPRTNSLLSVFHRKLQSSVSSSEFSRNNDKCQKRDEASGGSANVDLGLRSPVSNNQKGHNTNNLEQFAHCSPSGCFHEFLANTMDCTIFSPKIPSNDVHQASQVGGLEEKDSGTVEVKVSRSSTSLKVAESAKAKSKISIRVVKNEQQHLKSASSECSGILTKLPIGHASELCQTGDSFSEASQIERGSLRRCLFDENQRKYSADVSGPWSPNNNLIRTQKVVNMSSFKTSGDGEMINLPKPVTGTSVSPLAGNCPGSISTSLGIGLHLNSVIYPRTADSTIAGQQSSEKVVTEKGNSSVFVTSNQPTGKVNPCSVSSNSIDQALTSSGERYQSKVCSAATSGRTLASDTVEQFISPVVLKTDDPTVYERREFSSEAAESDEKFILASSKMKRKKPSSTTDDETSKRCNCKKSRCLKLYCDCFAAGFYCGESCACEGCINRPEHEDTVLETRRQIESRNPLAFAPKVVPLETNSPACSEEVGNLSTPSSARHKRGCNCKKSMCLKKYCECYQSNVGCSDSCRCEGCKNIHGRKEGYSITWELSSKEVSEATPGEMLNQTQEVIAVSGNIVNRKLHNSSDATPVTPVLLCSGQRKNALKSRPPPKRFLQSSDSHHDMLPSNEDFQTCRNSANHCMVENGGRSLDVASLDSEKGCENSDRLLTSCNRPANASHLVSAVTSSSSKPRDLVHASRPKTFSGSGLQSPSSDLHWQSIPVTPITQPAGTEIPQNYDSGSKHNDVLGDYTPDILQELAAPTESVKVRSPNKKRITPPHSRIDSPETLRGSRKFVLQAVCGGLDLRTLPKFPSLSPCSGNSSVDNRSESSDP